MKWVGDDRGALEIVSRGLFHKGGVQRSCLSIPYFVLGT
jgi:hypothetical protein